MKSKLILSALAMAMMSCTQIEEPVVANDSNDEAPLSRTSQEQDKVFYYYGIENRQIFLNEIRNKAYVKTKSDERSRIGVSSLNEMRKTKEREDVVSAEYLLEESDGGDQVAITDEFAVKLREGISFEQFQQLAKEYKCTIGKEDEFVSNQYMLTVHKHSELNALQMANRFYETGLFEFSEPNFIMLDAALANDVYYAQQWVFVNFQYPGIDINGAQAWEITKGSPDIKIAVLDDGVDLTHPDLQGNLLPGHDATGKNTHGAPYYDGDNHGTNVAGIIAALQNNPRANGSYGYEGITGVAPECKMIPVKISEGDDFDTDDVANGINWAM